jgi:amino acid efflux transporter
VCVAAAGIVELTAEAFGALDTNRMVTVPTSLFLVIYAASTASATRLLRGPLRIAAALGCLASVAVLAFSGVAIVLALLVAAAGLLAPMRAAASPVPPAKRLRFSLAAKPQASPEPTATSQTS